MTKKDIVIRNYFERECTVDTSIREAYTKGFERGLSKQPHWTSCKECLPDEGEYLITTINGDVTSGFLIHDRGACMWKGYGWRTSTNDPTRYQYEEDYDFDYVKAWMYLPNPYKEAKNDK